MMFPRNRVDCIRWITFTLYLMLLITDCEVEGIDKKYKAKQKRKRSTRGKKTSENIDLRSVIACLSALEMFCIFKPHS